MNKSKETTYNSLVTDIRNIIEEGRRRAFASAGQIALLTYWNIGRRIVEEEQSGNTRAAYGKMLIPDLAEQLTSEYGSGYGKRNLAYYRKFYLTFNGNTIFLFNGLTGIYGYHGKPSLFGLKYKKIL
jgi:hypothetical protein